MATILNIAFTVLIAAYPPPVWHSFSQYVVDYRPELALPSVPALMLAPAVLVLMTSIMYYAPEGKKILGRIGMLFAAPYAAMTTIAYFLQLTMVRENIARNDLEGLVNFVRDNPHSAMAAVDALGYAFLSLAVIFVTPAFRGGRLDQWVRWLFLGTGILGLIGVVGFVAESSAIGLALIVSGIVFLVATILLIALFRRELRLALLEPSSALRFD